MSTATEAEDDPWVACIAGWSEDATAGDAALQAMFARTLEGSPDLGSIAPPLAAPDLQTPPRQVLAPRTPSRCPVPAAASAQVRRLCEQRSSRCSPGLPQPELRSFSATSPSPARTCPPAAQVPAARADRAVLGAPQTPGAPQPLADTFTAPPDQASLNAPPLGLPRGQASASRLQPFPPPRVAAVPPAEPHYASGSPVLATSDPYVTGEDIHRRAVSPCFSGSPPLTRPRTPKPRSAVKEGAKPAGPFRVQCQVCQGGGAPHGSFCTA